MKDSEFVRGERVPMTKREVRAVVLERLALTSAGRFIDVGAGTGSVAIEAALKHPQLNIIAIEKKPQAIELIKENCRRFGCEQIRLLEQEAPCDLGGRADAIFIGGSGGNLTDMIHWSLAHLIEGGRLVLNFILHTNLNEALAVLQDEDISQLDCTQLQVASMTSLGSGYYFKPNNPTFVVSCKKGKQS